MRIVAARLNHETNTFSPVPTTLASFDPQWGADAHRFGRTSNTALGAFHAFAAAKQAELITPLAATANPSGPVDDAAFETMVTAIVNSVKEGCDAILLDLHGAMVTRSFDDGEGELLARIRAAAPDTPIGVALDLHGNITRRMLDNCDCIIGFKTYPHIDMYATGEHVTRIIELMLRDGFVPSQALCHPPMLAATLCMNTNEDCAMTDLVNLARAAETRPGIHGVTIFGGFPIADLAETGVSIVVVAASQPLAQQVADELAAIAWQRRAEFVYREEPLTQSLARAVELSKLPGQGPVLLLDHGDNCMSGGTCDNVEILGRALQQGLRRIVAGPFCDPQVVAELIAAGPAAQISIELGNKIRSDRFELPDEPLRLTGSVAAISDGDYVVAGPIYTGQLCHMGRAVKFVTEQAIILITELPHEPWDLGVFHCADIDPLDSDFLLLKSRMYCRPVFQPLSRALVECAGTGVTSSNYDLYDFKKLARPIYPLDHQMQWPGGS